MQGRCSTYRQQGEQGEEQRQTQANAGALNDRPIGKLNIEFNGQDLCENTGQEILNAHTEERTAPRANKTQRDGLDGVNAEDLIRLRAHAAQDGDGCYFLACINVNGTGNADTSEQEGGKGDKTEEDIEIIQYAIEASLTAGNGFGPQILIPAIGSKFALDGSDSRAAIKLKISHIRRQAAKFDEARFIEMR